MKIHRLFRPLLLVALASSFEPGAASAQGPADGVKRVRSLKVLVLSTMLADSGMGEWGFAALVEADGNRILFDTGAHPDTVLNNAKGLGIDLSGVKEVVLSHNHADHTGGFLTLRRELSKMNAAAVSVTHVAKGIFWRRPGKGGEANPMVEAKRAYETMGGKFVQHDEPAEILPGVWLTGPVARVYPERNWPEGRRVETPDGLAEDNLPEDMSLVVDTDRGLVVLSGCGHAGIVNTLEYARRHIRNAGIYAALGGFHLFGLDDERLKWTAAKLRELGLKHLLGAHCTGIEAVFRLRQEIGLDRRTCLVGAVGSSFTLDQGIDPLKLAK